MLDKGDIAYLLPIMVMEPISIGGIKTKGMYSAICREALSHPQVIMTVVTVDGSIAGYMLSIANNYWEFWRKFAVRHPFVGFSMFLAKLKRSKGEVQTPAEVKRMLYPDPIPEKWTDRSLVIAKMVALTLDPQFQAQGLGPDLYNFMVDVLTAKGFKRCDAHFNLTNIPSAKMHIKTGWKMTRANGSIFATRYLNSES